MRRRSTPLVLLPVACLFVGACTSSEPEPSAGAKDAKKPVETKVEPTKTPPAPAAQPPAEPAPTPAPPPAAVPAVEKPQPAAKTTAAPAPPPAAAGEPVPVPAASKQEEKSVNERVVITTEKGNIVIQLYEEDAPKHCENFKKLARQGFYNGLTFHRVIEGFMAQGGDPQGDGTGGPGYTVPAEIKRKHVRGSIAAARRGDAVNPKRESSGSQFYICFQATPQLDGQYTVFGQVVEGMDVVDKLKRGTGANGAMVPMGSGDKMTKVEVVEGGK